mgnify:CR=1 FL=1
MVDRTKPSAEVRPEVCTDEMLEYLDKLRESGVTNMLGGGPYLEREFPELAGSGRSVHNSSPEARAVLSYWMATFGERQAIPHQKNLLGVCPVCRHHGDDCNGA